MEKVFKMISGFFNSMTALFMTLLSFGVIAEILFGKSALGMSVIDNVTSLITQFGNSGVVGLMALVILYGILNRE